MNIKIAASITALCFASGAYAQGPTKPEYSGWEWGAFVERVNINAEAAAHQSIEDGANALGFGVEYYLPQTFLTLGGGLELIQYSDLAAYSLTVRDNFGDVRSESTDASATAGFVELGFNYPFQPHNLFVATKVGLNGLFESSRSISYCTDCPKENIDIDGGLYFLAQFGVVISAVELGLEYKQYLAGDLESAAGVTLTSHFF